MRAFLVVNEDVLLFKDTARSVRAYKRRIRTLLRRNRAVFGKEARKRLRRRIVSLAEELRDQLV